MGENEEKALTRVEAGPSGLVEGRGFRLETLDEAWRLATAFVKGNMAPKGMSEGSVVAMWQAGAELGITPSRALAKLTHIGGRIGMMVDGMASEVRKAGGFAKGGRPKERWLLDGKEIDGPPEDLPNDEWPDGLACEVYARPADDPEDVLSRRFSVANAKKAKLWNKRGHAGDSAWVSFPARMLRARALGWLLRDEFDEHLGGIAPTEELRDVQAGDRSEAPQPPEKNVTPEAQDGDGDPLFDEAMEGAEKAKEPDAILGPDGEDALGPQNVDTGAGREEEEVAAEKAAKKKTTKKAARKKKAAKKTKPAEPEAPKVEFIAAGHLCEMLAKIDHPMLRDTVKEWTPEQRTAAKHWAEDYATVMEAVDAGLSIDPKVPKPSFIPEYGDPAARPKDDAPAQDEENPGLPLTKPSECCQFAFDDGAACGLAGGHEGPHERL